MTQAGYGYGYGGVGMDPPPTWVQWAYSGIAGVMFAVSNLLAFLIALCVFVYVLGLGDILFNVANSFTNFTYWRIYGPGIAALLPFLIMFTNYQLRKGWASGGSAPMGYNSAIVSFWYFLALIAEVIIFAFLILCIIWYGVADFVDCASHGLCSGTNLSSKPNPGAIMIMVAWGLIILFMAAEFIIQLYLWYSVRQVLALAITTTQVATLASRIGDMHPPTVSSEQPYHKLAAPAREHYL